MTKYTEDDLKLAWQGFIDRFISTHFMGTNVMFYQDIHLYFGDGSGLGVGTVSISYYPDYDDNTNIPCGFTTLLWDDPIYATYRDLTVNNRFNSRFIAWISRNRPLAFQYWKIGDDLYDLDRDLYYFSPNTFDNVSASSYLTHVNQLRIIAREVG